MRNIKMNYLKVGLTVISLFLFAQVGHSQIVGALNSSKDKVHMNVEALHIAEGTDLKEALKLIEREYNIVFLYQSETIESSEVLNETTLSGNVEQLLENLLADTKLEFKYLNPKTYGIYKKVKKNSEIISFDEFQLEVRGTVTDSETGESIPGVSVVVDGTSSGTVTDFEGNYSLEVPEGSTLVFSFVGYETQSIEIGNQNVIDVSLSAAVSTLDELVVLGYGSVTQRDLMGSVSNVSSEDITNGTSQNVMDAIQGKASGIRITNTSGTLGAPIEVQVRGVNSINSGTAPLWVIDGQPVITESLGRSNNAAPLNPMASINPNDIESIEVLKDAAATAIYGSRGSNGVVLVTTKAGRVGERTISVDYSTGITGLTKSVESMGIANSQEWFEIVDQASMNSGQGVFNPSEILGPGYVTPLSREEAMATDTDWADHILRNGSFQNMNVSINQGSENTRVFASINYRNDKGINLGNDMSRFSGRLNMDLKPIDNLNIGTRLNVSVIENFRVKEGRNLGSFGAVTWGALPWMPIFDESNPTGFWNPAENHAVASERDLMKDKKDQYRVLATLNAAYSLPNIPGLAFRAEGSLDFIQDNATEWQAAPLTLLNTTSAYEGAINANSYNYNAVFNYINDWDIHSINAVGGTESQRSSRYTREMSGRDLVSIHQEIGTANPGEFTQMNSFLSGERYLRSYFLRTDYKLLNRYLIGASIRRDGSSAFDSEFRWGTFAALSAGWIISDESFYEDLGLRNSLSFLKLRGSFGQTGNQDIPNNRNLTTLINSSGSSYGPPSVSSSGTTYNVGNRTITWETTDSYDVGLEFGLFEDRISGTVDYYKQVVSDMLLDVRTPPSSGINDVMANVGDMENWGFEFQISSVNINNSNFRWTTDANLTTNQNRITRLTPAMEAAKGNPLFVGGSLGLHKMNLYRGIHPERGVHMIREINREVFDETGEYVFTGRDIPYTEQNGSLNMVVLEDKSILPTFFGGINNTIQYKGFDLSVLLQFSGGNWIYNDYLRDLTHVHSMRWNKKADMITESWEPGKTDAKYPLLYTNNAAPATTAWDPNATDPNTGLKGWWTNPDIDNLADPNAREGYDGDDPLSKYLEKGDYLRLRTVTLGYNLPQEWTSALNIQNIRVNVTGNNLWTLTEFSGWDPESGHTYNTPVLKNYSFGINLTF